MTKPLAERTFGVDALPRGPATTRRGRPRKVQPLASAPSAKPPTDLEIALVRDLSTCLLDEVDRRWGRDARAEVTEALGRKWRELVPADHHPLYFLAERCWFDNAEAKDNPAFLYAPLHRDRYCRPIAAYVTGDAAGIDGFLLLGPRDTYKSTFSCVLAMWYLLRQKHLFSQNARVVMRHHKLMMASKNLLRIKAKFRHHAWVRRYWSEYCPDPKVKDWGTRDEFTLPNAGFTGEQAEASVRAIGLTASDVGFHSDLDIGDDLVTDEHITSKAVRDEAKARYEAKQFTRDTLGGKEVNIGTRYHVNDLWASLEKANAEGERRYTIVKVKAIAPACTVCGCEEAAHESIDGGCNVHKACLGARILAHPYRLTKAVLEKKMQAELSRTGRVVLWYLQYQNEPQTSALVAADPTWLRRCSQRDVPPDAWPVLTIDPAWKGTKNQGEGDSASIQVWFIASVAGLICRWLVDGVHSNELTSDDGCREIVRLAQKYGVADAAPEEHGGYAFRTALSNYATERGCSLNLLDLKMKQTGKDQRIVAWLRELQAGRIYLCSECDPDLQEHLVDQITEYPQVDHDDAIDAAAYTCDPNIADAWVPKFRQPKRPAWVQRPRPAAMPTRTRHCGI